MYPGQQPGGYPQQLPYGIAPAAAAAPVPQQPGMMMQGATMYGPGVPQPAAAAVGMVPQQPQVGMYPTANAVQPQQPMAAAPMMAQPQQPAAMMYPAAQPMMAAQPAVYQPQPAVAAMVPQQPAMYPQQPVAMAPYGSGMAVGMGGMPSDTVTLQFSATKLENKDNFSKSDPFFCISKALGPGHWQEVAKSGVVNDSLNPRWPPITIAVNDICNGDFDKQLQVSVWDHDSMGNHDLIGSFTTTLRILQASRGAGMPFTLINPRKQGRMLYRNSGTMNLTHFDQSRGRMF